MSRKRNQEFEEYKSTSCVSTDIKIFMEKELKYKQTAQEIKAVTDEICELLTRKNESYGDSALNPKRIFSRASVEEQINVRLDDKLSRLAYGNGDHFHEDVELDIIGYLVLRRIARKRQQVEEPWEESDETSGEDSPTMQKVLGKGSPTSPY